MDVQKEAEEDDKQEGQSGATDNAGLLEHDPGPSWQIGAIDFFELTALADIAHSTFAVVENLVVDFNGEAGGIV